MTFLNPGFLWALAAAGAPVAIHLINKFRVRDVRWAAMRFLEDSLRINQRRRRLEDLLLLLLRVLLVALLVGVFVRPAIRTFVADTGAGETPAAAVIVLDHSASMGQSDGVQTRFDLARKTVGEWLDTLPAESRVALLTVSDTVDALVPRPTTDRGLLRRGLRLAQLSDRPSDLAAGINAACQTLRATPGHGGQVRVYTDGQTTAWTHADDIRKALADNPGITLVPVVLGERGEDNLGVVSVEPSGDLPAVRLPTQFKVSVANYGRQAVDGVRVTLAADGGAPSDQTLIARLEPGTTAFVELSVHFETPGPHSVEAAIPSDRWAADNARTAVVEVVNRLGALVLEGGDEGGAAMDRDGFFLANALVPVPRERRTDYYLKATVAPLARCDAALLGTADTVFLCNPGVVPPAAAKALADYVRAGGGLVIFPGARTDPARWEQNPDLRELLPMALGARRELPGSGALAWQARGFRHPVTALWNDPEQGNLGAIRVTQYFPLLPKKGQLNKDAAPPAVIAAYVDGQPAVAEGACGRGRVVLFGMAATTQASNLPLHPAFVPLINRLLGYLDHHDLARGSLLPGAEFEAVVSNENLNADFSVVRPGADKTRHVAGKVEPAGDRAVIRYAETEAVGLYRVFLRGDSPVAMFAVGLAPSESDLRQLDAREIAALARTAAPDPARGNDRPAGERLVATREFWLPLLWVAVAVWIVEWAAAHWLSQAR